MEVSITGDDELARALKLTGAKLVEALGDAVNETALGVETSAKKNLRDNGTTAFNRLATSIGSHAVDDVTVDVKASTEYAEAVEFGAAPHWAPIGPLLAWARKKLGDESAAYAVQHKIAEQGTPAQPYMTPAREEHAAKHRDTLIKHARRVTGSDG